ncbi:GspE/PulE family protein [Polynucleobacter sp. AM-26B4]|uniref:GspE/PulE family protein n=1 Tax=Polynucleobacter sp. AM-26B4 TaxID=2689103 RepID=UPI001C0B40FC|nr:GspE/PulE family protein [Polynucleobacter sp. AM-26B4]MBU3585219.1 type II/IV secretion system protein [Polynucleobacter sp. AM-26B4]
MIEQDDVIIHYWQDIVDQALLAKASDIHIEPENGVSHVRLRVDGCLSHLSSSPAHWHDRLSSRIKILARLDISEKRLPQDGQMLLSSSQSAQINNIDCRVSTLPTLHGEKIVLRVLSKQEGDLDISKIGLDENQKQHLLQCLDQAQGMILVTGPTGSGKTQTLYSCLKYLMDGSRNITSIEDPVEIQLQGINQVPINEKAGLRFDVALRALMRQDPDVIMVGEIRDAVTAKIALQAAETGHLVLATLHANDAPSAIFRLKQLGCLHGDIANNVSCITAQRLVRIFCTACSGNSSKDLIAGCSICNGSGFHGRKAVHQVMRVSDQLRQLIESEAPLSAIQTQCHTEKISTLKESAQTLIASGLSSEDEIRRQFA